MNASWTKFRDTWMVRVEGDVIVDGDFLTFTVVKKDGSAKEVMTFNAPEFVKDGVSIFCPIASAKSSDVAHRNTISNAKKDGATFRNGFAYHV